MKIYLGSDHAGYELKEIVKAHLMARDDIDGVVDHGAYAYAQGDDYPDFVAPVVQSVITQWQQGHTNHFGIVFGHSGQGEAMVANRIKGIRATVYYGGPEDILVLSRQHNDANVLSLGAGFIAEDAVCRYVDIWLETAFSNAQRHVRRINKIDE